MIEAKNRAKQLFASGSYTATQSSAVQNNLDGKGVEVTLNVSSLNAGTPSVTLKIEAIDPVSGNVAATLLTGAAVSTVTAKRYTVYPGVAAAANVSASDVIGWQYRVTVTHTDAQPITYSVHSTLLR